MEINSKMRFLFRTFYRYKNAHPILRLFVQVDAVNRLSGLNSV